MLQKHVERKARGSYTMPRVELESFTFEAQPKAGKGWVLTPLEPLRLCHAITRSRGASQVEQPSFLQLLLQWPHF